MVQSPQYRLDIFIMVNFICSIGTYALALGASSLTGHPMLPAGAAHSITARLAPTTNDFKEFLRSRLQISHDWQ